MPHKSFSLIVLAVMIGFVLGYSTSNAAPPPACDMYECRDAHGYWLGTATVAWGVFDDQTLLPSSDAQVDIFTPISFEKKPSGLSNPKVMVRLYTYTHCVPLCGLDANKKWQAPQEVALPQIDARSKDHFLIQQNVCTQNGGKKGPTIPNPPNANTEGNTPPGWKE